MTLPWWMIKKQLYEQTIKDVEQYSGLCHCIEKDHFIVFGAWPVYGGSKEQSHIEDLLIKILFPNNYPKELPEVYETGGRIKIKNADTHFYPNKSACLFYPRERYLLFPEEKEFRLKTFLDGPVKNFFFSQLFYIYHNKWPFGQRSHNIKGLLEFYGEKLDISCDTKSISTSLSYLLKPQIKGHWPCPCGNDKIRKCHVDHFRSLSNKIPKKAIDVDMDLLIKYVHNLQK